MKDLVVQYAHGHYYCRELGKFFKSLRSVKKKFKNRNVVIVDNYLVTHTVRSHL